MKVPKFSKNNKVKSGLSWEKAPDIEKRIKLISSKLEFEWKEKPRIFCFRSTNSKARAYARIWGLPKIWQISLNEKPAYILEVLSEKYGRLGDMQKNDVLIHELAHIPKNVSGSLIPHYRKGKRNFHKRVRELSKSYNK